MMSQDTYSQVRVALMKTNTRYQKSAHSKTFQSDDLGSIPPLPSALPWNPSAAVRFPACRDAEALHQPVLGLGKLPCT